MSWDVWLIRTKTNLEEYGKICVDDRIPISKKELIAVWKTMEKEFPVSVEDIESNFPHMRGDGWFIEAAFYDNIKDDSISLEIRGNVSPSKELCRMADLLKARAFDTCIGHFLEVSEPNGFEQWKSTNQKARDAVVKNENGRGRQDE